jgi:death-on-curing protein
METFLTLNAMEIDAIVDEQEQLMLDLATGRKSRDHLIEWLHRHVKPTA